MITKLRGSRHTQKKKKNQTQKKSAPKISVEVTGVNCGLLILQLRFDTQITSILSTGFPKSRLSSPFCGLDRTESNLGERRGLFGSALVPLRGCLRPLEAFERGARGGHRVLGLSRRARGAQPGKHRSAPAELPRKPPRKKAGRRSRSRFSGSADAPCQPRHS